MHVWTITCLTEKLDVFLETLADLDPTRLVVVRVPGKKRQTIQYFAERKSEASQIALKHGGKVSGVTDEWKTAQPAHAPIRIRDRFVIVETASSDPREIVIPAGLAFGTGDHPTTASCLRLLCDVAKSLGEKPWTMLDVGTGSGVLAIAARKLGATRVEAFDYDPLAVRTAKENARLNNVRGIHWSQQDLLKFSAEFQSNVVTANIFSELFQSSWSRIRPAILPGGFFILSGILRFQADGCRRSITGSGLHILKEIRLGKWVTFLAQSEAGK